MSVTALKVNNLHGCLLKYARWWHEGGGGINIEHLKCNVFFEINNMVYAYTVSLCLVNSNKSCTFAVDFN